MKFLYKQIFFFIFLATLMLAPLSSQASTESMDIDMDIDMDVELKQCSEIIGRINRLICYDDLAKKMGHLTPDQVGREEVILETYGFWEVSKKRNPAGEESIYLKNESVENVTSRSGLKRKPIFIIKCTNGKTDMYFDWKSRLTQENYGNQSHLSVIYQLGTSQRVQSQWELSTDRNALFVPNAVDFIKKMRNKEKLIIQIQPPYDRAQTIVHNILGLDKALKILVERCYP